MIGWVFPGQGSQHVGMASALTSDAARSTFTEASDLLGWDVAKACDEGPAERLDATEVTQPAMLTVDVAAARTLHALGLSPDVVAGHSVGEFAALVAAGVLSFEDALRAVNVRADAMRRAGRAHPGGMAAVVGLTPERVEALCAEVPGMIQPANFNAPDQVVVSGESDALAAMAAPARAEGARVLRLKVSVAAHSPLMRPARDELAATLAEVVPAQPRIRLVSGVTGEVHDRADELLELAVEGVTRPVRWVDCVRTATALGAETFVEAGPGRVLSGLIGRTAPEARTMRAGDDEAVSELARSLSVSLGGGRGHVA